MHLVLLGLCCLEILKDMQQVLLGLCCLGILKDMHHVLLGLCCLEILKDMHPVLHGLCCLGIVKDMHPVLLGLCCLEILKDMHHILTTMVRLGKSYLRFLFFGVCYLDLVHHTCVVLLQGLGVGSRLSDAAAEIVRLRGGDYFGAFVCVALPDIAHLVNVECVLYLQYACTGTRIPISFNMCIARVIVASPSYG